MKNTLSFVIRRGATQEKGFSWRISRRFIVSFSCVYRKRFQHRGHRRHGGHGV